MKLQNFDEFKLNETGEWNNDEDLQNWIEEFTEDLEYIQHHTDNFFIKSIRGYDKYQGPHARVTIDDKPYEMWTFMEDNGKNLLLIVNYPISNVDDYPEYELDPSFIGDKKDIVKMLNKK